MGAKKPAKATGDSADLKPVTPKPAASIPATSKPVKLKPKVKLTRKTLIDLYEAHRLLSLSAQKETGLRIPVELYFKDPLVAELHLDIGIDKKFTTPWEPGLRDGPTSARFAVVDYDSTTNTVTPPAVWNRNRNCYFAPDRIAACRLRRECLLRPGE